MADMLKFRKGTYAQINAAEKVAGTIYIAKDEKAMYVDVDASTRIRIGDFIRVDTVEGITPPYSTSALYYVEADNALLKYDGSAWKQVNGTDDLADRLTTAENAIDAVEGLVGTKADAATADTAFGRIAANAAAIDAVEGYVGEFTHDTAKTVVEYIDAKTAGIATSANLEALTTRVTAAEGDIDALEGTVSGHTASLATLNGAASVEGSVNWAKAAADAALSKANEKTTMAEVEAKDYATKTEAQGYANAKDAAIEAAADAAAAAQATANAALTKSAFDTFKTENATAISNAAAGAVEDANEYTDGKITDEVTRADNKYATKTALKATDDVVSGHTQAISGINTALESVVTKTELEGKGYATTTQVATAKQEAIDAAATAAAGLYATQTALNTTNDNVSAAQGRADAAYTLAEGKTTAAAVKDQIEAYGYATTGQVATAKQEAIDAAKTAGDAAYAAKSLEGTVAGHTDALEILNGDADTVGSVAEAKAAAKAAQDDIDAWETAHANDYTNEQINTAVADAKKAGTDAGTQAETNRQAIATLKGTVDKLDGTVDTEGSVKKQIKDAVDAAKTALSAEIDADIRAANAMEYAGTVAAANELPATAKNGATYVVSSAFGNYAAGDMLIAQGTEDPDTGLITDPTWAHVKSGYDASLDQKLTGADNAIKLSNGVGGAGTQVAFAATGSASVTVANDTVTIGMVWEDFNEE